MTDPQHPASYPPPALPTSGLPAQQPPPGAYRVPIGGYPVAAGPSAVPLSAPPGPAGPGVLSLVLALFCAVPLPVLIGFLGFEIGRRVPEGATFFDGSDLLVLLSPAREIVLWAEISFWVGTVAGIVSIVLGILAITRRRGRGAGIAGVVIAPLALVVYTTALVVAFSVGAATAAVAAYT